jgi:hypothetical protein
MLMSNKTYDILKNIALYVLPALATLILTLGNIWGIPYAEAIAATITAIDTFLGTILKISTNKYNALQEMHEADEKLANSPLYPEDEKGGE